MSCKLTKKNYFQAFDKNNLLLSYCETSGEIDQAIVELFVDIEDVNLSDQNDENSKSNYK